jgi:hypothetical protein
VLSVLCGALPTGRCSIFGDLMLFVLSIEKKTSVSLGDMFNWRLKPKPMAVTGNKN